MNALLRPPRLSGIKSHFSTIEEKNMEYQIDGIPGFESRKVVVQSAGYLAGAKLLVDGDVIKNNWGKYTLRRNDGTEVQARLQSNLIDPVPQLVIGKQKYFAVKPLEWYELVWAGWPIR
jgi:hypothetical protein